MGTYFTRGDKSPADVVARLRREHRHEFLATAHRIEEDGEHVLWAVERGLIDDGEILQVIACYVIQDDGNGSWGYKPLDETMYPYFYSCPITWLKKYPAKFPKRYGEAVRAGSNKWRQAVKAKRLAMIRPGKKPSRATVERVVGAILKKNGIA